MPGRYRSIRNRDKYPAVLRHHATPKADGSIFGTKYARPSALAKVTGTWDFGADLALKMPAGTLRLALVQAKVSHAIIKGIDATEAEKMPGVAKVITWKDVKGKNAITGLITFPTNKGDGWDRPILCKDKVFQFGDAIAIVAADTVEMPAAAEKVKVDLDVLPAYMSGFAALAPDAMEIHPGTPNAYYEQGVVKWRSNCVCALRTIFFESSLPIVIESTHESLEYHHRRRACRNRPHAQGVRVGNLVFTAGQGGLDPVTGQVVTGGIKEQTARTLENLKAVLEAAGSSLGQVVKATVFLKDMNDFAAMNASPRPPKTAVGGNPHSRRGI